MKRILAALFAMLLLATVVAQDFAPIPPLKSRVTDLAGMLKPDQQAALEKTLQAHEAKTGNQVAVLLIKSTAPEVIEQYSIRLAEAWRIGRKGVDDGVILIIAKDNPRDLRRMRLEVGRGAEGVITDAMSKRILQDIIAPYFRKNDFYGGLNAGVDAIHKLLNKEAFPSVPKRTTTTVRQGNSVGNWLPILLFPLYILIVIINAFRRRYSLRRDGWERSSSGIFIGGGGWDSGSSGGSDSGGFSGGGGDFGGGGASGDW